MTLNTAQYIAPLNSQQVLNGYVQGVKQGIGVSIAADGTISLDATGAATLGFLVSSTTPAPIFSWSTVAGTTGSVLTNDGLGNVSWSTDYVQTFPLGEAFPHKGAAAIPAGLTADRPVVPEGGLRYNTDFDRLEFFNGSGWIPVSPATGGVFSFVGNVLPTANAAGDLWFDTSAEQEKVWTGATWVATTPLATTTRAGRVKIGSNVQVAVDGTISVLSTTGVAGGISNLGVTTITDNVTSFSIDSALSANQGRLLQDQINALLIANNLTFAGLITGAGVLTYVTPAGAGQGFSSGGTLPGPSVSNEDYFVIVESAGGFTPPGGVFTAVTQGDWFISTGATWQFLNVGYDPPYASETVPGIIELATQAETNTGTDDLRAITPLKLSGRTATETRSGIAQIATQAEADAGVNDTNILTPLKLFGVISSGAIDANDILLNPVINGATDVQTALNTAVYDVTSPQNTILVGENPVGLVTVDVVQATETQRGGGEIATQVETNAGTSDTTLLTPLKLAQYIAAGQITAPEIPLSPTINGEVNVQDALTNAVYDIQSPGSTLSVTENVTGLFDLDVVQASEGQLGGAQIATDVETQALASDTVIVTPLKLGNLFASGAIDANDVLLNPLINGKTNVQDALADAIYDISSSDLSVIVVETAVGQIDLTVTQATETQLGGGEIATQAEADAAAGSASDTVLITPKKLANRVASETLTGIAELATQAETDTGTDDNRIVTPLKLRTAAVYKSDFNAKGDILSASANDSPLVLSVGTNGQYLRADSTQASGLIWDTVQASDITVSPAINGNTDLDTILRDAIYDVISANTSITVSIAATGLVTLTAVDATAAQKGVVELATPAEVETGTDTARAVTPEGVRTVAVYKSDFNAKGDLLSATANDSPAILGVGADGQVLSADSAEATGLKWITPSSAPAYAIHNLDTFVCDGVASSFNLEIGGVAYTPVPSSNIMVFLGGVPQIPGAANSYTVAGSVITFTSVPPIGTTFFATTVK